jgi:O-antigen/teichoic acid export membrane protein
MVIVVPHYLGDVGFGRLSFAWAFVSIFTMIAALGVDPYIVKTTARDAASVGQLVVNALAMKIPLLVALSLVAIGTSHVLGYTVETRLLVAVACLGLGLQALNGTLVAGLQGEQRMGRTALWAATERYLGSAAIIAAIWAKLGIVAMALASACAGVISLVANAVQLWHRLRAGVRIDTRLWRVLAYGGAPFLLWNLALMAYGNLDFAMLSFLTRDAVVGWYALAYQLVSAPAFLPTLIVTAFFPALSAQGAAISPYFLALSNRAVRMVFFLCAPMAVGIALIAADIIALFHYPTGFAHSIPLMRILALHIPLVGVDTVLGSVLMACDLQKQWVVVGCLAVVFNLVLNLVAIPATASALGNGAIGASLVTVLTELFMFAGAVVLRPRGVLDKQTTRFLFSCCVACLPLIAGVTLAANAWLPVKIAVGVATYGMACVALRLVSLDRLASLVRQFASLPQLQAASRALFTR